MKKIIKKLIIFISVIGVPSLLLTLVSKSSQDNSMTLYQIFFDRFFLINLAVFVITGWVFVDDQGTFNVFKYATKHFLATTSNKYKYAIKEENSLDSDQEIKEFLKQKYLYAPKGHSSTTFYFYCSCIVLVCFFIYSMTII